MSDDMDELRAEQERILAMPARAAFIKLHRLRRTARIFRGNAKALLDHLRRMDDPAVLLSMWTNEQASMEFLHEAERHLHNYVAAAQSRVDHLRRFKREAMPEGLREEYQRRIDKEFDASPLHNFITDLRNLILHVRLPISTDQLSWQRGGPLAHGVLLDSADLLRWDGWSRPAREYIEGGSGKKVDLRRAVSTYTDEIMAFDRWVEEGFVREHQKEMESYQRAGQEFQARLRQLGLSDDPETS